jgi:glutathione reductase (NADPH)
MDFDLLVIGAGSGGLAAAKRAASYGARVAIAEGDRVGGTCVIRGCVPKKLLVYASEYQELFANASSYGWQTGQKAQCNSSLLLTNVRREVDRLNNLHISLLEKAGVELIPGFAQFLDPHRLKINGREVTADRILIAVGGRPHRLAIPGAEKAWLSDDLFLQEKLPASILIVGAGYIACEFACILSGLGVAVTQVVRGDRLLKEFDSELAAAVQDGMAELGINLCFGQQPTAIEGTAGQLSLVAGQQRWNSEAVLLATGRRPFLEGLGLDQAGVKVQGHRLGVDAHQTTNVGHIYAVGDVTDRVNLTPVAVDEGRAFADTIFGQKPRLVNHNLIATAVFTQPELATVGLSEEQALAQFGDGAIRVHRARFRSLNQALPARGPRCLLKLVVEKASDRVLGCHMVGSHAAEIIQMAAIALGMGATKADFDRTMALHPSISEEFVTMT